MLVSSTSSTSFDGRVSTEGIGTRIGLVRGLLSAVVGWPLSEGVHLRVARGSLGHSGGVPGELPDDVGVPELVAVGGFDPAGLLYGVLAVATVIAAESTRHETFAKLLVASVVTMVLYWLAHAYSRHWASRLHRAREWTLKEIAASLWFEASILLGALLPTAVLVIAWAAGAGLETAVTALLWTAVFEIVVLEVVPAIRNRLRPKDLLVQTVAGVVLGVGILVLHLVLH